MTQRQNNSLTMFLTVQKYLDDNSSAWNTNTIITAGVEAFRNAISAIQKGAGTQQSSDKKGYTAKKDHDMENLIALAYKLALRVKNYAVSINDPVLKKAVDFSKTQLEAGKETDLINRCTNIVASADTVVAAAPVEYKITPELIAQVSKAADLVMPDTAERNVVSGTHTSVTSQLGNLFTTAKAKLDVSDDLIEGDADDDAEDFVRSYFIMRRTADHKGGGGTTAKETGGSAITDTAKV